MLLLELLYAGLQAIEEYIALHVITCLVPAFLLAGAIVTFISRETVIKYLGYESRKLVSFPLAVISSVFLAVCSCTVIPISAGIHRRGGGIGPAFILLWTAPATNLLALTYTGAILGFDMALVRAVAAVSTAFIIGFVMVLVFAPSRSSSYEGSFSTSPTFESTKIITTKNALLIALLVLTLLTPNYLGAGKPFIYKVYLFLALMAVTAIYAKATMENSAIKSWLHETLWFVRIIFPLLLVGVFIIGIVGKLLPEEWIRAWLGGSGVFPTFLASIIGALSYFATLTEAPFVRVLMELGMGKGPALALLLNGPGLSFPNMVAIAKVFGVRKAAVYVCTTVILATVAGVLAGNFIW